VGRARGGWGSEAFLAAAFYLFFIHWLHGQRTVNNKQTPKQVAVYMYTLQHAATRCNTLQHAATRCNTQPNGQYTRNKHRAK